MPKKIDLVGHKYGYITIKAFSYINKHGKSVWLCKCECGKEKELTGNTLRNKNITSCGCKQREKTTKHGLSKNFRPYNIWCGMKQRCFYKKYHQYKDYGGRGITMCSEWRDSFEVFWNDMKSTYSDKLTIDRIDVNGNYCQENCRWVTWKQQAKNKRGI